MSDKIILTAEYVRSILDYNPDTGIFTWRPRPLDHFKSEIDWKSWNTQHANEMAGSNKKGYSQIQINKNKLLSHRLAWFYFYGEWPTSGLDHINGIKNDNRICNLRLATDSQNSHNVGVKTNNKSGFKGVSFSREKNKWRAAIALKGKTFFLGYYKTPEEAHAAYCAAATKYHGEFARTE
jgi:hypothetical protein